MLIGPYALQSDTEQNMQALLDQGSQWDSEFQFSINIHKSFALCVNSAAKLPLPL